MKKVALSTLLVIAVFVAILLSTRKSLHDSYSASYEIDSVKFEVLFLFDDIIDVGVMAVDGVMEPILLQRTGTRAYAMVIADTDYIMNYWNGGWEFTYKNTIIHLTEDFPEETKMD